MIMENSNYDIQIEKSEIAKHFRENVDRSRLGKNLKLNFSNKSIGDNEDRTEENLIDDDENSTDFIDDDEDGVDDEEDEDIEDEDIEDEDEDYESEDEDEDEDDEEYEDYEGSAEGNIGETVGQVESDDSKQSDESEENDISTTSSSPEYEPFFPELSESTDVPVLLLKTTIVSDIELETKTITTTKLRTYTFVITRVAGNEEIITTTTEVKPQIKTTTVIESSTLFKTLTLVDLDNMDKTDVQPTFLPTLEYNTSSLSVSNEEDNPDFREEPRNLATRVMSNGVEVIVAGDKTTYPGDKDFKRILQTTQKAVTLKPSTLTDHMLLVLPQETTSVESSSTPLDPNQFVVKTCLTTFTYLTTYLEKGTTTVSSHEQVVSNVATEERMNTGKILPTPAMGITLTQYPTLSVGVFHTTYTYLNTILDGEQPLVISSQHVVANTVTAPDDYLSLLNPSELKTPVKDTNTYFSTIDLEKTLYEDGNESVISTREVVTQVVITESIPPRDRPVMTSYIALDMIQDPKRETSGSSLTTTDVTKTYFVTYTYYNTIVENGVPTVYSNVSTESDIVTEKVLLHPKKTNSNNITAASSVSNDNNEDDSSLKFDIFATKVYFTTFTYFTTLLKENDPKHTTIIKSSTKVVENIVTETLEPKIFDPVYLSSLSDELKSGSGSIQKVATLSDGQLIEITVQANDKHNEIKPTKVLPIQKTQMPYNETSTDSKSSASLEGSFSTTKPNIITGSTIVFIDDDPFANLAPTPSLSAFTKLDNKISSTVKNNLGSLLASEVVKETKVDIVTSKVKRPGGKKKSKNKDKIKPSKSTSVIVATSSSEENVKKNDKNHKKVNHPAKITGTNQAVTPAADLLGLGSININTLQALTPVLSAMAGYINKNLKSNRRNDVNTTVDQSEQPLSQVASQGQLNRKDQVIPAVDIQNRSPVYIPVGGIVGDDFEIAESQNIATFDWNDSTGQPETPSKLKQEAPLLGNNGIPISPGDIITANSDVIVGKPGRVGPRIPSAIPLHREPENEVPLGMKPPPPPPEKYPNWGVKKNNGRRPQIPVVLDQIPAQTNVIHAPNNDDYVGPPPPARPVKEKLRGEKRKHIPLISPHVPDQRNPDLSYNVYNSKIQHVNIGPQYAPQYSGEQPPPYQVKNVNQVSSISLEQNLQETIHKNYDLESQKQNYPPIYAADQKLISPSSVPIVLPEVIERSTGQPLLVQLQPSQVAFVNIPFNRTTALIYGGSTETHHNGQYFDDPSPYPEPEFNPIESFKNGLPQFASIYHDTPQINHMNQKQVSGVIKVGSQMNHGIKVEPDSSANSKVSWKINPTRPNEPGEVVRIGQSEINLNIPPLSFGMTEQHGDIDAHIINHQKINMQTPSVPVTIYNNATDNLFYKPDIQNHINHHQLIPNRNVPNNQNGPSQEIIPSSNNLAHNRQTNQQFLEEIEMRPLGNDPIYPEEQKKQPNLSPDMLLPQNRPMDQNDLHNQGKPFRTNRPKYPHPPKRNLLRPRPRPHHQISEYMTPPPVNKQFSSRRPVFTQGYQPEKDSLPIPLANENQQIESSNFESFKLHQNHKNNNQPNSDEVYFHSDYKLSHPGTSNQNNRRPEPSGSNSDKYHHENTYKQVSGGSNDDLYVDEHLEDDSPNEDGEVIQESNPRPLKPGEVPLNTQINHNLKYNTQKSPYLIRFPDSFSNSTQIRFPYNKHPRPELILPAATPFEPLRTTQPSTTFFKQELVNHNIKPSSDLLHPPNHDIKMQTKKPESQTEENTLDLHKTTIQKAPKYPVTQSTTRFRPPTKDYTKFDNYPQTQKPVLIFIDENGQKGDFFHKIPNKNTRPKVTSLPIDTQTTKMPLPAKEITTYPLDNLQTEKSFDNSKYPPAKPPTNEVNILASDQIPATTQRIITDKPAGTISTFSSILLNNGEDFDNLTQQINNMEVLQPPPLIESTPKIPSISMEPPKVDVDTPSHHATSIEQNNNKEKSSSTPNPFIPDLFEELIPPAPESTIPTTELVLGMNPPPLVSTHRPVSSSKRPNGGNGVYSMEIDIPREPSTTTKKYDHTRIRLPSRRKPGYRRTTTSSPPTSSTSKITSHQGYFKTSTKPQKIPAISESTTPQTTITPTPPMKNTPSMEVIVGQPQFGKDDSKGVEYHQDSVSLETNKDSRVEVTSKAPELKETDISSTTLRTPELAITIPQDLKDIIIKPVHHAGNEVKIVDEPKISSMKDNKSTILPTKYITHTKTHSVTITKTTVVKTLGGPPSTLTLLVTKTEKSYIVDTVTEVHTLLKPTSIVETVTTTIQKENSLYPNDAYQSNYPIISVAPTPVINQDVKPTETVANIEHPIISSETIVEEDDDSLEDFIIKDSDDIPTQEIPEEPYDSNESIFVVMTDKNKGTIIKMPPQPNDKSKTNSAPSHEDPAHRDEITDNEVSNVLLGGILTANHPSVNSPKSIEDKEKCTPECKPTRNELCQKVDGVMRCICRPGFARMFPDRPCNPTYTYSMNITIDKLGKTSVKYSGRLSMENTTEFIQMARKVHEALDRMVMQSDLRDIYHGVKVTSFYPAKNRGTDDTGVISTFYLQLSDNIDEIRMEDIFKKYLRNNNYSLGGTDVTASSQTVDNFRAQDFNECENNMFHDCSENAQCFNLRGTYTCSCKEGYSDLSENMLYPGRICSADQVGCDKCNYHGTCYTRESDETLCECFHWYAGEYCQINLKVLLIALVTLGTVLFALLLVCIILTCVRKKPKSGVAIGFLPQRVGNHATRGGTMDRRAMIEDTSSEDSRSEANSVPPYVQQKPAKLKPPPPKGALKKVSRVSMTSVEHSEPGIIFPDQKDRSLTVMIPRAKYCPAPPTSPLINYTTFDARKPSVPSVNPEAKLLSYLDAGPSPVKSEQKRKFSNAVSEQFIEEKSNSRKTSGALISAGFEVSATVVNTMGTLGTTCGTEADRSENATLIQKISADLLSRADTSSQFNTLRNPSTDDDLESNSNWMDIPRISTVSESRSYDETTIPPPMKSFTRSEYDTKSLQHQNDEANTMAERDLGSTFLLPHTHLYKPDRGSDISGFESL